jgi:superfamily II DNA or RNA helicase
VTFRADEVVRIRGARWRVTGQHAYPAASILEVEGCDAGNRGARTAFLLPCEPIAREPAVRAVEVVRPARWRRCARRLLAASASIDELRTPAAADIAVLPFQLEPALALVRGVASRVLVADEVGLGKTVQAGVAAAETLARVAGARVLVVAPAGLRDQWAAELEGRFHLDVARLDSAALARAARWSAGGNPWSACPLAIASIDYVKRPEVMRALEGLVWDLVVFDEAHGLSGRSDRRAAASAIAARARAVVLLTATPHSGDEASFARLRDIGAMGGSDRLAVFRRTRADAGLASRRRTAWLRVRPTEDEARMHRALTAYARLIWSHPDESRSAARLATIVLMRRACSSAASLARSVERRLALVAEAAGEGPARQFPLPLDDGCAPPDDDEPGAELAGRGLDDRDDEVRRLQEILDAARVAARRESKLRALVRLLGRVAEPAIVFTEYRDTLDRVVAALEGVATAELHGGLLPSARAEALGAFTAGAARVLVATDAASEGLNLHERCRLVINLELPWTPLRLEQRIGRADRIGQRRTVHAVHLVAAGTGEQHTVAALAARTARAWQSMARMRVAAAAEDDIARSVLGLGGDVEAGSPPPDPDPLVVVPDLREAARLEAERVLRARALLAGPPRGTTPDRPFAAIVRGRRRRAPRAYCVFRLEFVDGAGHPLWETLLALAAAPRAMPPARSAAVRAWIEQAVRQLSGVVAREQQAELARLGLACEALLATSAGRERAIMAAVAERHARMAAPLVQPGLFDRRAERLAAAQAAVRDEILDRCRQRLAALARAQAPSLGRRALAFAVLAG